MTEQKKKRNGYNTAWLYCSYRKAVLLIQKGCTTRTSLLYRQYKTVVPMIQKMCMTVKRYQYDRRKKYKTTVSGL